MGQIVPRFANNFLNGRRMGRLPDSNMVSIRNWGCVSNCGEKKTRVYENAQFVG